MAIRRWEMLLSAQADSYLLKIQGDRTDIDRIVQAHTAVCQNVQEISEDTFQWAIFVVGATLAEKLAIQNQVMSLTTDAEGKKPSDSLLDVIEGLSGALQDLTNLTDDEQAYVMNKMARMGQPTVSSPAVARPPAGPATPRTPAAPRATPSVPGRPLPPVPGFSPKKVAPQPIPGRGEPGTPLPPVSIPGLPGISTAPATPNPVVSSGIVRPVQPPKSFGAGVPQTPLPPVTLPKVTFPGVPTFPKGTSHPPPPASSPSSAPIMAVPAEPAPSAAPVDEKRPVPDTEAEKPKSNPSPAMGVPHTSTELIIEKRVEPLAARTEPPAAPAPKAVVPEEKKESSTPTTPEPSPVTEIKPTPVATPDTGAGTKPEDGQIQAAIFFPPEGEEWKNTFLTSLSDIAQKKSKKPTHFKINASVAGPISLDNSTEWIWKSKTTGADLFFVVLPPDLGTDLMEPVVAEAESAGLRCFLVPQSEIRSKLLYMDLMVELMMFKKRIRPSTP